MIKAEVVFRGEKIYVKDFIIIRDGDLWDIFKLKINYIDSFIELEQAIAYCLEN